MNDECRASAAWLDEFRAVRWLAWIIQAALALTPATALVGPFEHIEGKAMAYWASLAMLVGAVIPLQCR